MKGRATTDKHQVCGSLSFIQTPLASLGVSHTRKTLSAVLLLLKVKEVVDNLH